METPAQAGKSRHCGHVCTKGHTLVATRPERVPGYQRRRGRAPVTVNEKQTSVRVGAVSMTENMGHLP